MNFMGRIRTDNVHHVDAHFLQRLFHYIGGLLLSIDFPAVSDGRTLKQIERIAGTVIQLP